jgi:hypothetical protein
MIRETNSRTTMLIWRFSLLAAIAVIGASVWLAYEVIGTILFFRSLVEAWGAGSANTDWFGMAILFGLIGLVGLLLPSLYLRWAWPRAFPNRSVRLPH